MFNLFTEFTVSGMSSVSFVSCVVLFYLLLFLIYFVNSESMDIVMMIEKMQNFRISPKLTDMITYLEKKL